MSDIDTEYFRQLLLKKRDEILALNDIRKNAQSTVELDQSRVGRLSRMDALQQQAMAQASQHNIDRSLKAIEAALLRCDQNTFGYCEECDEPIVIKRLEFDPTVTCCIQCAEEQEQQGNHHR